MLLVFWFLIRVNTYGAATNLPDISVIGDITAQTSTDTGYVNRNRVTIQGIELALQGYLYPQMHADIFLAMHRHENAFEPEICEASVSFLRLFLDGLGLQAGKIHVDFGKLNKVHQHERPFTDQPLTLTNFLGCHGLVGEGATLNYLFPLPFFLRIEGGAWRMTAEEHHHEASEEEPVEFSLAGKVYTGRLWTSFYLSDKAELEIGASVAKGNGSHYLEHKDEVMLGGADMTIKMWLSTYKRLIFQNELFYLNRKVPIVTLDRYGAYSFLGMQFNKCWDAGLRYDWAQNAFPDKETGSLVSIIGTYKLTEMSRLRLQYGFFLESEQHQAVVQLVFGIGPHSHPLQ
jgi:hypothetical protein